ncbi:MAG: hypothetical protein Q4B31_03265 [Clostridia bacterium]|nr:hypothetical protein [Clostridia bacterium]
MALTLFVGVVFLPLVLMLILLVSEFVGFTIALLLISIIGGSSEDDEYD